MDKLEPILKNHFWILLVPLFSMNLWGYFSANGALKAATSARETALDGVKSSIPDGTVKPNEVYSKELTKQNDLLEKYVKEELLDLWNRQQARMVWPPRVAADIPKKYRAEIENRKVRNTYQTDYPEAIQKLHESVEPFVADKRGITWTPKVDFPVQLIPRMKIGNLTIASEEMWDAQEDIWVTQLLLDAIRQMNKDADSETSAVIRRVIAYRLLGGNGESAGSGAEGGSESMGDEGSSMSMGFSSAMGGQGAGGGAGGAGIVTSVKFDPAEEFGTGGEPAPGGGAGGSGSGMMMSSMMSSMAEEGDSEASADEPTGPLRYVKEDKEGKFVERGFYLSVIINQNKLVDFLVALSNSEWPVRVVRFHFGKNPYAPDPFNSAGGGGGGGLAGLGGISGGGMSSMGSMGMRSMGPGNSGSGFVSPSSLSGGSSGPGGSFSDQDDTGSGLGSMMGGGQLGGAGANTGYDAAKALQHPDLVQLDLAGLITLYRQPESEVPEGETPASEATTPEEASAETPAAEAAATPAESEAPATEASTNESSTPATEPVATEAPATESGPADPAVPAGEATTDAPAAKENPTPPPVESSPGEATPPPEVPATP